MLNNNHFEVEKSYSRHRRRRVGTSTEIIMIIMQLGTHLAHWPPNTFCMHVGARLRMGEVLKWRDCTLIYNNEFIATSLFTHTFLTGSGAIFEAKL